MFNLCLDNAIGSDTCAHGSYVVDFYKILAKQRYEQNCINQFSSHPIRGAPKKYTAMLGSSDENSSSISGKSISNHFSTVNSNIDASLVDNGNEMSTSKVQICRRIQN